MNDANPSREFAEFECSGCQTKLKVPVSQINSAGAQCPRCQQVNKIPLQEPANSPVEPVIEASTAPSPTVTPASSPVLTPAPVAPKPATSQEPESMLPQSPKHQGSDTETKRLYKKITDEISKLFVGQEELVMGTLVALFSGGHVLIESVPGLGKTLFVRTLGKVLGCKFGRIQFTADLMPSDITGAPIFNMKTQEFDFRPGPVFTQFLLADEINRAPAKTHAALLEIMQEKNVTIDGKTHELKPPFLVMATQNPIESEGTYNLPEAQLDRFMFKLVADYPGEQEEAEILMLHSGQADLDRRLEKEINAISTPEEIAKVTQATGAVRVDPLLVQYINKMVRLTRQWPAFLYGSIGLVLESA